MVSKRHQGIRRHGTRSCSRHRCGGQGRRAIAPRRGGPDRLGGLLRQRSALLRRAAPGSRAARRRGARLAVRGCGRGRGRRPVRQRAPAARGGRPVRAPPAGHRPADRRHGRRTLRRDRFHGVPHRQLGARAALGQVRPATALDSGLVALALGAPRQLHRPGPGRADGGAARRLPHLARAGGPSLWSDRGARGRPRLAGWRGHVAGRFRTRQPPLVGGRRAPAGLPPHLRGGHRGRRGPGLPRRRVRVRPRRGRDGVLRRGTAPGRARPVRSGASGPGRRAAPHLQRPSPDPLGAGPACGSGAGLRARSTLACGTAAWR